MLMDEKGKSGQKGGPEISAAEKEVEGKKEERKYELVGNQDLSGDLEVRERRKIDSKRGQQIKSCLL